MPCVCAGAHELVREAGQRWEGLAGWLGRPTWGQGRPAAVALIRDARIAHARLKSKARQALPFRALFRKAPSRPRWRDSVVDAQTFVTAAWGLDLACSAKCTRISRAATEAVRCTGYSRVPRGFSLGLALDLLFARKVSSVLGAVVADDRAAQPTMVPPVEHRPRLPAEGSAPRQHVCPSAADGQARMAH